MIPITLESRVARTVGKIISDGVAAPHFILNARTDDGISCTLVAFITKNIAIAYSVFGYFSSSCMDFMPIGVVAPLIPRIFADIFSET